MTIGRFMEWPCCSARWVLQIETGQVPVFLHVYRGRLRAGPIAYTAEQVCDTYVNDKRDTRALILPISREQAHELVKLQPQDVVPWMQQVETARSVTDKLTGVDHVED